MGLNFQTASFATENLGAELNLESLKESLKIQGESKNVS